MNNLDKIEKQFRDSLSKMEVKGQRKSADIWNGIEGTLESKSRKRISLLLVAFAGLALIGSVIYFTSQPQENTKASGIDQLKINSNSSDIKNLQESQVPSTKENTVPGETNTTSNLNSNPNSPTPNSSLDAEKNVSQSNIDAKENSNRSNAPDKMAAQKPQPGKDLLAGNSGQVSDHSENKKSISDSKKKSNKIGAVPSSIGLAKKSDLAEKSSGNKKNSGRKLIQLKENEPGDSNKFDSTGNNYEKNKQADSPGSTITESYNPYKIDFKRILFQLPSGNLAFAKPMDIKNPNDHDQNNHDKKPVMVGLTYIPELYWMKKTDLTNPAPLYSSSTNVFAQFRKEKLYFQTGLGLSKMSYEFNYHSTSSGQLSLQNVLVGVKVDTMGIITEEIRVDTTIGVTTTRDIRFNNSYQRIRLSSETGKNCTLGKSLFQYGIGVHVDYIFNQRGRYVNQNNEPLPNISNAKDGMKKFTFTPYLTSRIIVPISSSWSVFGGLQVSYLPSFNWNKSLDNQGFGAGLQLGIIKSF